MTEAEWNACTDPTPMLEFLRATGRCGDRKMRLFLVACCRRLGDLLTDDRSRQAVEAAERFAEGVVTEEDLAAAERRASDAASDAYWATCNFFEQDADSGITHLLPGYHLAVAVAAAAGAAVLTAAPPGRYFGRAYGYKVWMGAAAHAASSAARAICGAACDAAGVAPGERIDDHLARRAEQMAQVQLLHEILGSLPFRVVNLDSFCAAWNDGTIRKLAQAIYAARAFDRLPILADVLEESGCTDAAILSHCRQPREHVRGCWSVDLLLGKS